MAGMGVVSVGRIGEGAPGKLYKEKSKQNKKIAYEEPVFWAAEADECYVSGCVGNLQSTEWSPDRYECVFLTQN